MSELVIRNRQGTRALNIPLLRRITRHLLEREFSVSDYELGLHFVSADEMATVNQKFLQHEGSTDVITFDYSDGATVGPLHGEIFICVADAVKQAREFRTPWQSEVSLYIIHGLLHLRGCDDLNPSKRRIMKREENRLVKIVASEFALQHIARPRQSPRANG